MKMCLAWWRSDYCPNTGGPIIEIFRMTSKFPPCLSRDGLARFSNNYIAQAFFATLLIFPQAIFSKKRMTMKTRHYTALATLLTAMAIVGCTTPNRGASSVGETTSVMQRPVQGTAAQNSGTQVQKDPSSMTSMQGMDHSKMGKPSPSDKGHASSTGAKNAEAEHGATAAGQAGTAAKATRTVNVKASDTMRFDPQSLQVKAGETIRFVVTNVGKLPHEFFIGTPQEQKAHAQMMQKMPGMKHEESNAISLAAGETKTLVWQFSNTQLVELACHVPGHYPAGMVSKVTVTPGR